MNSSLTLNIFLGFALFKILISSFFGHGIVSEVADWSPSFHLRRLLAHGRYTFLFQAKLVPDHESPKLINVSLCDYFLIVIMALAQLQRHVLGEFCDILVLSAAFSLWTVAKAFGEKVHEQIAVVGNEFCFGNEACIKPGSKPPWVVVAVEDVGSQNTWQFLFQSFQAIQNMAELVNVAFGNQVTWFLLEGLMVYAINLNVLLTASNELRRLRYVTFYCWTIMIIYFSTDIGHQLGIIR